MLKARLLWVLPVAVVGSWLAVRTLAASTVTVAMAPPPILMVSVMPSAAPRLEIKDVALARRISRLAALARQK
jgi:hypothetical protein